MTLYPYGRACVPCAPRAARPDPTVQRWYVREGEVDSCPPMPPDGDLVDARDTVLDLIPWVAS